MYPGMDSFALLLHYSIVCMRATKHAHADALMLRVCKRTDLLMSFVQTLSLSLSLTHTPSSPMCLQLYIVFTYSGSHVLQLVFQSLCAEGRWE